ncbi:MAG: hypothetical protein ABIL70_09485 [candidate division WOR-3 bacterium]
MNHKDNDKKKEKNNDMKDRFTPEGIPITTPLEVGIDGILQTFDNIHRDNNKTRKGTKINKAGKSLKRTSNKIDYPGTNETAVSLVTVIILILLGGLSWL